MSGTDSRVFYDNSNTLFNFTTPGWNLEEGSQWADGSRTVYREDGADGGDLGEFSFTFNGTAVSFLGSVPTSLTSQALKVQLDQGEPFEVSLRPASRLQQGVYREIFEISEIEGGGEHVVRVTEVPPGLAVDFASVNDNVLDGKDVIWDDVSATIRYWGSWKTVISHVGPVGLPYAFTTHSSSTEGDSASLVFSGSSFSIHGLFNITSDMVVRFKLDDNVEDIRFSPSDTSQGSLNFPWFSRQNLSHGSHFFSANLLEPNGQTFYLDYVRYAADTPEEREAAADAQKARFPYATLLGILAGIVSIFLATMVVVCLFRQSRKRAKAAGNLPEIRQRTDPYLDLDMELGPVKGEPALGRAGPNAFVVLPPTEAGNTSPQNLEAHPFIIPASRWAALPPLPPSRNEKATLKAAEPLYHEVQQPSTSQPSPNASHQIDELQRAVQILAAETENLRGRLRETSQSHDDAEPPPYEDPRLPSRPSSRLLTPPSSMSLPPPPGLPPPPPVRKGRR